MVNGGLAAAGRLHRALPEGVSGILRENAAKSAICMANKELPGTAAFASRLAPSGIIKMRIKFAENAAIACKPSFGRLWHGCAW
jgi:hypothetical protein